MSPDMSRSLWGGKVKGSKLEPLIPWIYKWSITLIMWTCRIRFVGQEHLEPLHKGGKSWIYSAWHENTAITAWVRRNTGTAMMASESRDGELIARAIELIGNIPVRGSTSRGGAKAAKDMVRLLRSGHTAAVTPDGPRGPRRKLQPGILYISAMSGSPLIPSHFEASRQWVFGSWDRHRIPKPFSWVYVCTGKPYFVDKERLRLDEAGVVAEVEQAMQENVELAERLAANNAGKDIPTSKVQF